MGSTRVKLLSLTALLICLSFSQQAFSTNLYRMFPVESETINGRSYPQNDRHLYCGTFKSRLSLGYAINAMLGSDDFYFESGTFSDVLSCLMKKKGCKKDVIKYEEAPKLKIRIPNPFGGKKGDRVEPNSLQGKAQYRRAWLKRRIELAKRRNGGRFSSYVEAGHKAQQIMDEYFQWLGEQKIYKNFIKFTWNVNGDQVSKVNTEGIAWPSEVIFSSSSSWVAALYGPRTVVFKEQEKRSVDLGYWNYKNSG